MKNFAFLSLTILLSFSLLSCGEDPPVEADFPSSEVRPEGEDSAQQRRGSSASDDSAQEESENSGTVRLPSTKPEVPTPEESVANVSLAGAGTYVCKKNSQTETYRLSQPGAVNSNRLCELDDRKTGKNPDWWANNQRGFCQDKLNELLSQRRSQGFACSQEQ